MSWLGKWHLMPMLVVFSFIDLLPTLHAGRVDVVASSTILNQNQQQISLAVKLSEIVSVNDVIVSCTQLQFGARKSKVTFDFTTIPINSASGNVSIKIISAGEAVDVSCYGYSRNNGSQYLQGNSTGQKGSLIVTKAPKVGICSDFVYVKAYTNAIQTFDIKLSEATKTPLMIECSIANASLTSASSLQLQFYQAIMQASQSDGKVQFRVIRSGSPIQVSCKAQSLSCISSQRTIVPIPTTSATTFFTQTVSSSLKVSTTSIQVSLIDSNASFRKDSSVAQSSDLVPYSINTSVSAMDVLSATEGHISPSVAVSVNDIFGASFSETGNPSFSPRSSAALKISSQSLVSSMTGSSLVPSASAGPTSIPPTASPAVDLTDCQFSFNTSVGTSVTFAIEQPTVTAYPASTELQSLDKHVSLITLDSALDGSSNMDLQCALRSISIGQQDQTVCSLSTGLPILGTGNIVLNTVTVKLLEQKITYRPGEIFKNVTVEIARFTNGTISQLLQAFCCFPLSNAKYRGMSVSVYLWINSQGQIPFLWADAPDQSKKKITAVESLDFSCPCNMREKSCDFNCCCDKDCSANEVQRFVCIPGNFGGRQQASSEFSCQAVWPERTDWTPILCVVTNNSPFLGYFFKYTTPELASSLNTYNTILAGRSKYTYEETESRNTPQSTSIGYSYGSSIRTNLGDLTLPSQLHDNTCQFMPVRYLRKQKSSCLHKVTQDTCMHASLNALNYLMPTGITYPACAVPDVLDGITSSTLVNKTIEYYCMRDSSSYIFSRGTSQSATERQESLFKLNTTTNIISRCIFDDSKTRPPKPSSCNATNMCCNAVLDVNYQIEWNGMQLRSVFAKVTLGSFPTYTVTQSAVTYTYYATEVIAVTPSPSLLLSAVSPSAVSTSSHSTVAASNTTQIAASVLSLKRASPSRTTTNLVASSSIKDTLSVSANNSTSSLVGSLSTAQSKTQSVNPASTSAAPYHNITVIRKKSTVILRNFTISPTILQRFTVAFKYQKTNTVINRSVAISVNQIANNSMPRSGNPGYVIGLPLISQTASTLSSRDTTTLGLLLWRPGKTGLCSESSTTPLQFGKDAISGCILRIGVDRFANCTALRELVKQNQDQLAKALRIAKRGNPSSNLTTDWLNVISVPPTASSTNLTRNGVCHDIPAHLSFEILISEAGKSYGQSQMEISGVRIRYVTATWSMKCASGKGARCFNTTTAASQYTTPLIKAFAVTSSVVFITIPAAEPPRVKRSVNTNKICKFDACIQELFYPLQNVYSTGVIDFNLALTQNATAMAVTLAFLAFGAVFVSRPWNI